MVLPIAISSRVIIAMLAVAMAGCAAARNEAIRSNASVDTPVTASADTVKAGAGAVTPTSHTGLTPQAVSGVWEGRSIAQCLISMPDPGRCEAMQTIKFTMFQSDGKVTGYYRCGYGNQVCRNLDDTGIIKDGKMIKSRLMMRVMLPDGSMCFFTGIPQNDHFNGGYSCLQGAGLIEQGRFYTQRSY